MKTKIESPEHWHKLRASNVGGSEIAALFDCSPYLTRLELWLLKSGKLTQQNHDSSRAFWGRTLEDGIAKGAAEIEGWQIENDGCYYTNDAIPGMGCTPDRFIIGDNGERVLLQIKNIDGLAYLKWQDGEPPLMYQLQVQHEIACTGVESGVLCVLVGGNQLKIYRYARHDAAIKKIESAITEFWQSIASGNEPQAVGDDYEILAKMCNIKTASRIDMSGNNQLPILCAEAKEQAAIKNEAERKEKAAKAEILRIMNDAEIADCMGYEIKRQIIHKKEALVKATTYQKLTIKELENHD